MTDDAGNTLEVGVNSSGDIVITFPDIKNGKDEYIRIAFTPDQARGLADGLLQKIAIATNSDTAKVMDESSPNPSRHVLTLWRVTIRALGLTNSSRAPFHWYVALKSGSMHERDAVAAARARFTSQWWDEHLIIAVAEVGKLVSYDGVALYEEDD